MGTQLLEILIKVLLRSRVKGSGIYLKGEPTVYQKLLKYNVKNPDKESLPGIYTGCELHHSEGDTKSNSHG